PVGSATHHDPSPSPLHTAHHDTSSPSAVRHDDPSTVSAAHRDSLSTANHEPSSSSSAPIAKQLPTPSTTPSASPVGPDMQRIASNQAANLFATFGVNNQMTNEQMAHELIMDPDFKLKGHEESGLAGQIRKIATKAYFDAIRDDFERGQSAKWIPILV